MTRRPTIEPLPAGLLDTLYAAFRALLAARVARGTLDLDLPERKVVLDSQWARRRRRAAARGSTATG